MPAVNILEAFQIDIWQINAQPDLSEKWQIK